MYKVSWAEIGHRRGDSLYGDYAQKLPDAVAIAHAVASRDCAKDIVVLAGRSVVYVAFGTHHPLRRGAEVELAIKESGDVY